MCRRRPTPGALGAYRRPQGRPARARPPGRAQHAEPDLRAGEAGITRPSSRRRRRRLDPIEDNSATYAVTTTRNRRVTLRNARRVPVA
jgi:hypothetical protein